MQQYIRSIGLCGCLLQKKEIDFCRVKRFKDLETCKTHSKYLYSSGYTPRISRDQYLVYLMEIMCGKFDFVEEVLKYNEKNEDKIELHTVEDKSTERFNVFVSSDTLRAVYRLIWSKDAVYDIPNWYEYYIRRLRDKVTNLYLVGYSYYYPVTEV